MKKVREKNKMGCSACHFSRSVCVCAYIRHTHSQVDINTLCLYRHLFENWNMCITKLTFIQIKHKWTPRLIYILRMVVVAGAIAGSAVTATALPPSILLLYILLLPLSSPTKMVKIYASTFVNIELKWFMDIEYVNRRRSNMYTYMEIK